MRAQPNDLDLYERHAAEWWDPRSPIFRSLRAVKAHHLELLRALCAERPVELAVDLGCGGGLLAVPLAREVGRVVGFDRSRASLAAAAEAARTAGARCLFACADIQRVPLPAASADLVLLSDVLEHLTEPHAALAEAARLLRTDGRLFVNTLNATARARFLAVTFAEGVGLVPRGTHDPRLFLAPARLILWARAAGLELVSLEGEAPRVLATLRTWAIHVRRSRSHAIGYNALFRKLPR